MTDPTLDTMTIRERVIDAMMAAEEWSSFFSRDEAGKLFDAFLADIERQGFLIVRLEGRVNDGEKPQ